MSPNRRRKPHVSRAVTTAKRVLDDLGVAHPTEAAIETLAYVRGMVVRDSVARGARASLVRLGDRGIVGVAGSLSHAARRFAIAHELGHFEVHKKQSYAGLCVGEDLSSAYHRDGREAEANAFAAEFLMPTRLCSVACDVAEVDWATPRRIADEYQVSLTAAAIRFAALCPERIAVVCSREGKVAWCSRGPEFESWISPGQKLDSNALAYDYFERGFVVDEPEEVPAHAWIPESKEGELVEHALALPSLDCVLSLLWIPITDDD